MEAELPGASMKAIPRIQLGRYEVDCWYSSPYPDGYEQPKLYLCEHCLKYYREPGSLARCCTEPASQHPPGEVVYCDGTTRVYEVDGGSQKLYAQCLCLLSKLFLDHASKFYTTEPYNFYIVAESAEGGAWRIVSYFSKEKAADASCNLACILTLPPYQKQGLGQFMIAFSYALSRLEGRAGTPER